MSNSRLKISRRELLKLISVGAAAFSFPEGLIESASDSRFSLYARVLEQDTQIYNAPASSSAVKAVYWQDAVLPITGSVGAGKPGDGGWYQLYELGYVPMEKVQPVRYEPQQPDETISRQGSLAEVSVPYAAARYRPASGSQLLYRYYFGSVHWVDKLVYDRYGVGWYRVKDDKYPDFERWVLASQLRVIPHEDLAPISPDIPAEEKLIIVDLSAQRVTAFEGAQSVFSAVISSGDQVANPKYQTPTGRFRVGFKRPSQHMLPWDQTFGDYDLPGVPWVCYFTNRAHAFHGAFWHNGFGTPRSHGCVNLKPEDARWIYRWSTPVVEAHDDMQYSEMGGTRVEVI